MSQTNALTTSNWFLHVILFAALLWAAASEVEASVPEWAQIDEEITALYIAAQAGDAQAQYILGIQLEMGLSVDQDLALAARYFKKAAAQGHMYAQYETASFLLDGRCADEDIESALRFLEVQAAQGDPHAEYMLGEIYYAGQSVNFDDALAAYWWGRAAQRGHRGAQHNLAMLYELGQGQAHNDPAAERYHRDVSKRYRDSEPLTNRLGPEGRAYERT